MSDEFLSRMYWYAVLGVGYLILRKLIPYIIGKYGHCFSPGKETMSLREFLARLAIASLVTVFAGVLIASLAILLAKIETNLIHLISNNA